MLCPIKNNYLKVIVCVPVRYVKVKLNSSLYRHLGSVQAVRPIGGVEI